MSLLVYLFEDLPERLQSDLVAEHGDNCRDAMVEDGDPFLDLFTVVTLPDLGLSERWEVSTSEVQKQDHTNWIRVASVPLNTRTPQL